MVQTEKETLLQKAIRKSNLELEQNKIRIQIALLKSNDRTLSQLIGQLSREISYKALQTNDEEKAQKYKNLFIANGKPE